MSLKKKWILGIGLLILTGLVVFYLVYSSNNDIFLKDIQTTTVTKGNVYKVIEASGEVAAENEVLLLCPYSSKVERIVRLPGNNVKEGEVIVSLDASGIEKNIEKLNDELEMLNNNLLKLQLSANSVKIDMDHDVEVKKLRIISLESELNDLDALLEVGGTSQAKIDKVKQELLLAKKELHRATEKHTIRLKQLGADEKGLNLQIEMKTKQLAEALELRDKMLIVSPGKGIILDVKARKGEIVRKDAILVRISEHTRLKIKAEISDEYQQIIRNGGKVFALVEGSKQEGTIGNIQPVIDDGRIQFEVFLKNPKNRDLRVNKKVKLMVVTEERRNVIRVKKHESYPQHKGACYVMDGKQAKLRDVATGLNGFEYIEIMEGLDSGEVVVVSDMPALRKKNVIDIKE